MAEPVVVTFGCRLNTLESQIIRSRASAANIGEAAVVNTCAVTGEAIRQARQAIRRLRRERPDRPIIVTGCAAQLDPASFAAMPEVDRVIGNAEKLSVAELTIDGTRIAVADIMALKETAGHMIEGLEGRTRAFVQVQQGCDHRCTFCIIPFARGRNRSVALGPIVEQVRTLVANGYAEVVLTGVDICSYGADLPGRPRLGDMVRRLLAQVPELRRLRLTSLDPAAIDDALIRVLADEPRLMPHIHLSLQALDDVVLKRMRRRHSRSDALSIIDRMRDVRPESLFGADLIAGFPTETDAMFTATLDGVEQAGLAYLHVFPFSARPGTPAARMPQVPGAVRRQRAALLREAAERARYRHFSNRIGTTAEVLVERDRHGRCPDYAPVRLDRDVPVGSIVPVRITRTDGDELGGEPL